MFKSMYYTHLISVNLFLLIYLVKTILLLTNRESALAGLTRAVKVPEMIISLLFLVTGIYMLTQIPEIKTFMIIKIILVFASIPIAIVGFKKRNKIMGLLSFLFIVGAYGLAEMSRMPSKTAATGEAGNALSGHDVYMNNCVMCHGDNGKLGLSGATDLSASTMDRAARIELIRNGKAPMPAYGGQLSEEEITAVADYTETLKK